MNPPRLTPPNVTARPQPHWPVANIISMLKVGNYKVKEPAVGTAYADFGFVPTDIADYLIKNLKDAHFKRTNPHNHIADMSVDHYTVKEKGLEVYVHLHVRNGELNIISFKES